jgi:hypothetical protein
MSYLFLVLGFWLIVQLNADQPIEWNEDFEDISVYSSEVTRNAERAYRLPTGVVPVEYDIYIDLYFSEKTENPFSYEGKEIITIKVIFESTLVFVEELDGPAVRTLGVRSRKLSNVGHLMSDQKLIISSSSVLWKALAVGPGCICRR